MSILVLDVGTTSMRGILYGTDGRQLAIAQYPNHVEFLPDGVVNESPKDWEENTVAIVRDIVRAAGNTAAGKGTSANEAAAIEAVAITSQRSSIIPVDQDGRPLMDTIMWQDVRNKDICRELSAHNGEVFAKTGSRVNTVFSGSKMTWIRRERPDIYRNVHKFVNIPEYINFLMCGTYCSDYTYASRSSLMNLKAKAWDPEMLALYEVDAAKLCELKEPGSVVGHTTAAFENATGLRAGTPVIHAGGDQQCAAIGQGVTRAGNVEMVLGTGGFLMAACDDVPENLSEDVICNAASIAGKYVIEANILACSAAYDWLGRELYGMEKIDYGFMEQELSSVPGVTDCLAIPYIKGRGVPDWNADAKAVFADITLATTRAEIFKSFLESLFMEFRNHLDTFSKYVSIGNIYVSGGMTKSEAICRLLADVTGREIVVRDDREATAKGAFLVSLAGLGHYRDVDEAIRAIGGFGEEKSFSPDAGKAEAYAGKQVRMNEFYRKIRE